MGLSGGGKPNLPAVKSTAELAQEAAQANIANLPALINAYKQYGPEAAAAMLTAAQSLNPTLKPLGELLNKRIDEVSVGGIPATLRASYETAFRNAQAARGFVDSPASSNAEAIGLATLGEDYAQNTITGANAYGANLPDAPGLADLGLESPSLIQQELLGQQQNENAINQAAALYQLKRSNKKAIGTTLGGIAGGALGGMVGGPAGAQAGAAVGAQAGGVFF